MKTKDFATRAAALVASRWVQDGIKALLMLWLARADQLGFGLFVFGAVAAYMTRALLTLGMDLFALRERILAPESWGRILTGILKLKALLAFLAIASLLVFGQIKDWNRTQLLVVLILVFSEVLEAMASTFFSLYRAEGRQVQEAFCTAAAHMLGAVYGVAAMLLNWGIIAFCFFLVFSGGFKTALAMGFGFRYGLFPRKERSGTPLPRYLTAGLLFIVGVSLLGSLYNQIQVFFLKHFRTLSDVAVYGAAGELCNALSGLVVSLIIGAVLYPGLVRAAQEGPGRMQKAMQAYFWRLTVFALGAAFFLLTLGGDLLLILFGNAYVDSVPLLGILGPATLLSIVNNLLTYALLAAGREKQLFRLLLGPCLVSIILGWVLIPRFGATGAALNLLACRITMSLIIFPTARREFDMLSRQRQRPILPGLVILGGSGLGMLIAALSHAEPRLPALAGFIVYVLWSLRWMTASRPEHAMEGSDRE